MEHFPRKRIKKPFDSIGKPNSGFEFGYIVDFIYDSTEVFYERGKHDSEYLNNIRFPLFMLKFAMLHLLCLPMIYFLTRFLCIGRGLDLNEFDISFMMFYFISTLILMRASLKYFCLAKRR